MQVTELKNTKTKLKNTLERINSRLDEEEWVSELEDKGMKHTERAEKKKEVLKMCKYLWDLWDNIKKNNICIIGVQEWGEMERMGQKKYLNK